MTSHQPQAGSTTSPLSAEDLAQFESLSFGNGTGNGNNGTGGTGSAPSAQHQQPTYDQPPPGSPPPTAKPEEQGQGQQQAQPLQEQQQQQQPSFAGQSQSQYPHPQGMRTASTFTTHGISNPEAPSNPYNPFLSSMPAPGQAQMQSQQQQLPDTGYGQSSGYSIPHQQDSMAASMPSTNPFANPQSGYAAPATAPYNPPPTEPPTAFPMVEEHQASAVGAPAPRGGVQGGHSAAPAPEPRQEDKAWPTKDVIFRGMDRKIVMQDENGPCSLIAIANILLLRGDLELQPPDRPLVNYDYLSSLIAEYLLTRPGDASLEQALSLLPQTQYGLNLNPGFISNETFYSSSPSESDSSGSRPGQLALFDLLGIKLYHGFLPDQSSEETYDMLISHGSYDSALDQVVRGDAIAEQFFREAMGEVGVRAPLKVLRERGGAVLLDSKGWGTALQRRDLSAALEVGAFLDGNASQLTYPGLFALSALPEGTLCALFRFNHLSVLYRPRTQELPAPQSETEASRAPPTLLTLLTDEAFLDEGLAVWESLADVDGSASGEIYDGRFRRRVIDQSARAGRGRGAGGLGEGYGGAGAGAGGAGAGMGGGNSGDPGEDADYALALQLHVEENERIEAQRQRRASRNPGGGAAPGSSSGYNYSGTANSSGRAGGAGAGASKRTSGLFGLGALGKKGKSKNANTNANTGTNGQGSLPEEPGAGSGGGGYGYEEARRGAADDFGSAPGGASAGAGAGGAGTDGPPGYGISRPAGSAGGGGSYGGGGEGYDSPAGAEAGADGRQQQKKKKDKDCVIM